MGTDLDRLRPGATHHGEGWITFALFAPGKQSVSLMGEFNNWDRHSDLLQPTDEGLWWIKKQFEPGGHTYQFVVDGDIVICDPYATLLAEGAEQGPPRAVVEVGRVPYRWRHETWSGPAFNDLIIYELHVGDFSPEGNFQGLIDRLDYLQDLGINAIELMPVFEFAGTEYVWGYNPAYFFAVEKSYGQPDDLRRLIDEAHDRNIAVILDLVLAHTAQRHPFNEMYLYEESPWYGPGLGELNQFGFPMLDYTKEAAQAFARDVQAYWLQEFRVDGFRYDYLNGIGYKDDQGIPFLVRSAREVRPAVHLIGEFSPENPGAVAAADLSGAWHVMASYALKALLREGEFNGVHWDDFAGALMVLDPWQRGYQAAANVINYMESHDEERVMTDIQEAGLEEDRARHKSALGASVLFTMPGQPMLYHGQEWGEATRRTLDPNPIDWGRLETEGGRGLFEHYCRLAHLRQAHPALRSENYSLDALDSERKTVVYHRWNDEGDEVVVAVNFSPVKQGLEIPFPRSGRWQEVLSGHIVDVSPAGGETEAAGLFYELESSTAAIFIRSQ